MKRRGAITLAGVMLGVALLGWAGFLDGRDQSEFTVRYGGPLTDSNHVRAIRHIVSHERWAVLWSAIRRRDGRIIRDSVRQMALGRLRLISGGDDAGWPAVVVYYKDRRNRRYWAEYTLRYQDDRWTLSGYRYGDPEYDAMYGAPDLP